MPDPSDQPPQEANLDAPPPDTRSFADQMADEATKIESEATQEPVTEPEVPATEETSAAEETAFEIDPDVAKTLGFDSVDDLRMAIDTAKDPTSYFQAEQKSRDVTDREIKLQEREKALFDRAVRDPWAFANEVNGHRASKGLREIPPPSDLMSRYGIHSGNVPAPEEDGDNWGDDEIPIRVSRELAEMRQQMRSMQEATEQQRRQEAQAYIERAVQARTNIMSRATASALKGDPLQALGSDIATIVQSRIDRADASGEYPDFSAPPEVHVNFVEEIVKDVIGKFRSGVSRMGQSVKSSNEALTGTLPPSPKGSESSTQTPQNPAARDVHNLPRDDWANHMARIAAESTSEPGSQSGGFLF